MDQNHWHFKVGKFDCTIISDGNYAGTAEMLFPHAPNDELAQAIAKHNERADHLPAGQNCLFVHTGENKVLVDTGIGPDVMPHAGKLLENLAQAGIQPAEIDTVFITHCHGDHIGGLTAESGNLSFPNARHYMWQKEWEHWTDEDELAKKSDWAANFARRKLRPLSERIEQVSQAGAIVSGISAIPAPGHTVGHTAISIQSAGDQLLYLADAFLHPIHIENPDWTATVDHDPEQTILTRKKLIKEAAKQHTRVLLYHFLPFPGLGQIRPAVDGDAWLPDLAFNQ